MKHEYLLSRFATSFAVAATVLSSSATALASAGNVTADRVTAPMTSMHSVNARMLPPEIYAPLLHRPDIVPLLVGTDPQTWALRKAAARFNRLSPYDLRPLPAYSGIEPFALTKFAGMHDSASTCPYFGGCAPPDMAIAASSNFVVQSVNTSIAVYSPTGVLAAGWPKNSTTFFGIPSPGPCDPNGPFSSDPRALYDPADGRFWIAMLQIEGPLINSCGVQTIYWVAVSATSDPTGIWHVYSFNMARHSANIADYTQIGLDGTAFYFGGNMFDAAGQSYLYDEILAADKAKMEAGAPLSRAQGFKNIKVGSTRIDTLQPVLVEGASPAAGLFIDSFNMNSGGGSCSNSCSGINLFAMANPLTTPTLSQVTIGSMSYSLPPLANQPGSPQSVETLDTRITGTPVYRNGSITFALGSAVNNGSNVVPGIMWGQVSPILSGSTITGGTMIQNAVLSFAGDRAASFGATMTDAAGDMLLVFDSMSSTINPGIYFASRIATYPANTLGPAKVLKQGVAPTFEYRWGDFEATSYDGAGDNIWFAAQYSNSGGDWSTFIGKTNI